MCQGLVDLKQEYIEEGFSTAVVEMVKNMFFNGISTEQIAVIVKKSVEEVEAILRG